MQHAGTLNPANTREEVMTSTWTTKRNRLSAQVRRAVAMVLLAVFSLGVTFVGQAAAQSDHVKIGLNKNLLFLAVWVAKERGIFEKNGIDAEFVQIADGTSLRTAILAGSIDFTVQVPEGSAVLHQQGANLLNVVATQGRLTWSLVLAGKYKDKVKLGDVSALKGMTIGVSSRGSGSDLQLQALLKANGLKPNSDVQIVAIGAYANGIAAMEQGRIDGMMCLEPARGQALAAGDFEDVNFGTEVYPGSTDVPMGALAAMKEYIDANSDLVGRVVASLVQAQSDMVADPEWTLQYAARLNNLPADSLEGAVKQQLIPALNPAITEKGWNTLMQVLVDAGALKQAVPYSEAVATQFAPEWDKFKH